MQMFRCLVYFLLEISENAFLDLDMFYLLVQYTNDVRIIE